MNTNIKILILSSALVSFTHTAHAAIEKRVTSVSVKVGSGSSSNPLRLLESKGSLFYYAEPQLGVLQPVGERFFILADASAQIRDYTDSSIGDNGRFLNAQFVGAAQYFATGRFEIGGEVGVGHYEGRDFAYEVNSAEGRPLKSSLIRPELYSRYNFDHAFAQARASIGTLRFDGQSQDEGGIRYKDDRVENLISFSSGYEPSRLSKVQLTASRLERNYSDRRARFTEGTPNTVLGTLREEELGLEIEAIRQFSIAKLKGKAAIATNRDLIKEANDNRLNRVSVAAEVPFFDIVRVEAAVTLWERRFTHFVPSPLTDPQSSDRRVDRARTFSLASLVNFRRIEAGLKFSTDDIQSNYSLADSREDIVEASLKTAF